MALTNERMEGRWHHAVVTIQVPMGTLWANSVPFRRDL